MKLAVIKNRIVYLSISLVFFVISLFVIIFWNLNYWIDMTGWMQLEFEYKDNSAITFDKKYFDSFQTEISNMAKEEKINWKEVINSVSIYKISWINNFVVEVWFQRGFSEKEIQNSKDSFKIKIINMFESINSTEFKFVNYLNIWASFWDYIKNTAIITLIIAIIWISLYIAWTFSWIASWISSSLFALLTIITLFHDVVIASWLYIITSMFFPEYKIDTFFVTALLTILWYSINDTIVVFDRIRSNMKTKINWKIDLKEIIDFSINDTITRSIYSSLTLFFVLLTTFIFWPESLKWFILLMLFWTIIWTYSSIFIASPLLYELNKNKELKEIVKKEYNEEDKIVV